MTNEKLQDVILDKDTLINYGDGEKPIKDFFKDNKKPVVIVKDMYGEAVEAVNLVEFEEYMQQEAAEAEEGINYNVANDYDILYKNMQNGKESYHCYKGRYTVGELDIIKNIKDNFSVQEGSCAMGNFPQYIEDQYQSCVLDERKKVFADIKACIANREHKYGNNEYGDKEVLYQYIDKNIIPNLPKESVMKRVKRKTRLILNLVQNNNRDDGRSRER